MPGVRVLFYFIKYHGGYFVTPGLLCISVPNKIFSYFLYFFADYQKICIFAVQNIRGVAQLASASGLDIRGVAQLASASGLGPEGPVFESQYPDIETETDSPASVSFLYLPDTESIIISVGLIGIAVQIDRIKTNKKDFIYYLNTSNNGVGIVTIF